MNIVKSIDDVKYNAPYWWNVSINKEATISNGLPNCTAFVVGAVKQAGMLDCVSVVTDARSWHKYLINGWLAMPYAEYKENIKVGDIIEWVDGNHVAIVSNIDANNIWISGSFYTGIHGKAYYDGSYDTREGINSLKQLNDFMLTNYEYRYFHYVPLEEECRWCGGDPTYVLVAPNTITPVERNTSLEQVYVGVNGLRVRTEPNLEASIKGVAPIGYYNAEMVKGGEFEDGSIWYKVENYYIAGVTGVVHYPKENLEPVEEMMELLRKMQDAYNLLVAENKDLKARLEKIKQIC